MDMDVCSHCVLLPLDSCIACCVDHDMDDDEEEGDEDDYEGEGEDLEDILMEGRGAEDRPGQENSVWHGIVIRGHKPFLVCGRELHVAVFL